MSQKKVDDYKEQKANRKQIMRKERIKTLVRRCVVGVLALALVGWIGFSVIDSHARNQPRAVAEVDFDGITDYLNTLQE